MAEYDEAVSKLARLFVRYDRQGWRDYNLALLPSFGAEHLREINIDALKLAMPVLAEDAKTDSIGLDRSTYRDVQAMYRRLTNGAFPEGI